MAKRYPDATKEEIRFFADPSNYWIQDFWVSEREPWAGDRITFPGCVDYRLVLDYDIDVYHTIPFTEGHDPKPPQECIWIPRPEDIWLILERLGYKWWLGTEVISDKYAKYTVHYALESVSVPKVAHGLTPLLALVSALEGIREETGEDEGNI